MRRHRRPLLDVQLLEAREVPAGSVTARVVGSVLYLTGDDQANGLAVHRNAANQVVVTGADAGGAGTVLAGTGGSASGVGPNNTFTTTSAAITSVRITLRDGDDAVADDTPDTGASPFAFTGGLFVDAGEGDNTLTLGSPLAAAPVTLGGLTYQAADGADAVTVGGGGSPAGNTLGAVRVTAGDGPATVLIADAQASSISLTAGEGDDLLDLTSVTGPTAAGPAVTAVGGTGLTDVTARDSTLGAVTVRAVSASLTLRDTPDFPGTLRAGALTVAGSSYGAADLVVSGTVATQGVSVASSGAVSVSADAVGPGAATAWTVTGGLTLTGQAAQFISDDQGGTGTADVAVSGAMTVRGATAQVGSPNVNGTSLTVGGLLSVTGTLQAGVDLNASSATRVGGLTVTGGTGVPPAGGNRVTFNDRFRTTGPAPFGGAVTITLAGGTNTIALGNGTAGPVIGALTVTGGAGADAVGIGNVRVAGPVSISTGAGNDNLSIGAGATFDRAVTIDQGSGADVLTLDGAADHPTTFTGRLTVRQGTGNDTLLLDLSVPGAFVFTAGASFDGGAAGFDDNGPLANAGPVGNLSFLNYEG